MEELRYRIVVGGVGDQPRVEYKFSMDDLLFGDVDVRDRIRSLIALGYKMDIWVGLRDKYGEMIYQGDKVERDDSELARRVEEEVPMFYQRSTVKAIQNLNKVSSRQPVLISNF